ncbi:hypothetical protein RP20_CCG007179 [Aedes albopictus]|nr:hypothetical protein RP20_CCG007179 [Aedes albopictus]
MQIAWVFFFFVALGLNPTRNRTREFPVVPCNRIFTPRELINYGLSYSIYSRTSLSLSSSLSDLVGSPSLPSSAAVAAAAFEVSSEAVLTIEDLRAQLGSCFTCGVMWTDQQVSLDCSECGGYSLERPCMLCDGLCGQLWKRDFTMSHACGKARWQGVCTKFPPAAQMIQLQSSAPLSSCASFSSHSQLMQTAAPSGCHQNVSQQFLQQELCARLEKLSATAHN